MVVKEVAVRVEVMVAAGMVEAEKVVAVADVRLK